MDFSAQRAATGNMPHFGSLRQDQLNGSKFKSIASAKIFNDMAVHALAAPVPAAIFSDHIRRRCRFSNQRDLSMSTNDEGMTPPESAAPEAAAPESATIEAVASQSQTSDSPMMEPAATPESAAPEQAAPEATAMEPAISKPAMPEEAAPETTMPEPAATEAAAAEPSHA